MKFAFAMMVAMVASTSFAQEPTFGPPPATETKTLVHIGALYFNGIASSVDEDGDYKNHPLATIRLSSVRTTGGRTYIVGTAQSGNLFYLAGPAIINSPTMRLKTMTTQPAIVQLEKGERFWISMEGEYESFDTVTQLPKDDEDTLEESNDGGNAPLFNPVPQSELPSAIQPRSILVPAPRDPEVEFDETPKPQAPIRLDGPVAGEPRKKN